MLYISPNLGPNDQDWSFQPACWKSKRGRKTKKKRKFSHERWNRKAEGGEYTCTRQIFIHFTSTCDDNKRRSKVIFFSLPAPHRPWKTSLQVESHWKMPRVISSNSSRATAHPILYTLVLEMLENRFSLLSFSRCLSEKQGLCLVYIYTLGGWFFLCCCAMHPFGEIWFFCERAHTRTRKRENRYNGIFISADPLRTRSNFSLQAFALVAVMFSIYLLPGALFVCARRVKGRRGRRKKKRR